MPAAPPLLPHRRVLGAADRRHRPVAGDADVAADALADVLQAALFDLLRQERVGDRRARGPDQVEHLLADQAHHRVGRGEAADADHGLRRQLLQAAEVALLPRLAAEARGERVVLPDPDHDVPDVRQLADEREELLDLGALETGRADQLVDDDPAGHRGPAVDLRERVLEDLPQQPRAVRQAAAVLVLAVVVAAREEVLDRRQAVRGVDVDQVVARLQRARDRLPVPAPQVGDVVDRHAPRLHRLAVHDREVRRAERRDPAVGIGRGHPAVGQLDAGERAVRVHLLDEARVRGNVGVVPQAALDEAADVGRGVDLDLLGAHDRPAALGLDAAHHRVGGRVAVAHAVAVRHLEEAVARGHRPEPDGLEQDVVAGVARAQEKRLRAITRRMMSLVPSQISSSFASRNHFWGSESRM